MPEAIGLLKNAKIGGALLYGPPGTGKTHLARILAKESNAAMIHVSTADMVSKWVGETEQYIKALFNLATMIWPCIIFIDEADSLFRSRQKSRESWEVAQVNQLLSEADGLVRNAKAPFLILATNYPQLLDHAVLRRVPGRIYMGLPSEKSRESLFRLFLRDERPEPIVDTETLAAKTHMYTSADIRNLCMLAAQTCADVSAIVEDTEAGAKKVLNMSHFEEAFHACGPTGSKEDLDGIRLFAEQFDP
ncbi:AAA-domain-containing protein, partial [Thozetella sp. PMI_491]